MTNAHDMPPLAAVAIEKSFGPTRALAGVDFALAAGEIHALVGENGAGKSTLIGILSGITRPDRGRVYVAGKPVLFEGPRAAMAAGIVTIPQELRLVPMLSVADNIVLGDWPTRRGFVVQRYIRQEAARALEDIGVELELDRPAGSLGFAERQLIVIAKALRRKPKVLILDEPTAALERREVERLLQVVGKLKAEGVALLYVTHRLQEIVDIADRCTVLRDGQVVDRAARGHFDVPHLVTKMAGRDLAPAARENVPLGAAMLTGGGVSVRAGEVVGLAGLLGSGAREMLQHFFGLAGGLAKACLATSQPRALRNPKQAMRAGIGLVPGERAQGLIMQQSVRDNIALPNLGRLGRPWWIRPNAGDRLARELIEILDIRPKDPSLLVTALSGGNQQKVIFAKWLACNVNVLLLDEPTHGVDILSKLRIHDLIRDFVRKGGAALMHSTDADELLALSNAILSIKEGHISRRLEQDVGLDAQILRETIGA